MDLARRKALKTGGGMTLMGALFAAGLLRSRPASAAWKWRAPATTHGWRRSSASCLPPRPSAPAPTMFRLPRSKRKHLHGSA